MKSASALLLATLIGLAAPTSGHGLIAVDLAGDSEADLLAVSLTGDSKAAIPVSVTGTCDDGRERAKCIDYALDDAHGYWAGVSVFQDASGLVAISTRGTADGAIALTALGDATGGYAFSLVGGCYDPWHERSACFDANATGPARGYWAAVSPTSNATSCRASGFCAAATATGDAWGSLAVTGTGDATGRGLAATGTGDAHADGVAITTTGTSHGYHAFSVFGDTTAADCWATQYCTAVSVTGHASGRYAVSGCDTLAGLGRGEACWDGAPPAAPPAPVLP